ncbi:hypothetical protein CAPTEDRAFT_89348 [Capitella teleta]|uniref:Polycystin cation channel PKD1/PKD2 domain-containing protein n=1 Tax=Capitella teleta TaxID=283909 RepID=R7T5G5_CAPTE|nr:hypothetical protein CAPTEDRAFT_89348 [Capitella teleta]|eukprot:ELT88584.1 hypothetical protein CAPTEDRAFT_89348 [Capitella teleta]
MLRLLRFNRKVAELSSVLSLSMRPLFGFFVSFMILYVAFAQFALFTFGRTVKDYSNFASSIETLFSMMLMNFSFDDLQKADPILGPAFFLLYVVVLAFVVINVLVSILNESYNKVKVDGIETETDYKMVDYIIQQVQGIIGSHWNWPGQTNFGTKFIYEHILPYNRPREG